MLEAIRAKILHAATPTRLAVVAIIAVIAVDQRLASQNPLWVAASIVLLSGIYAVWRPSEPQRRHQMADDDKMIVPLHRSAIAAKIEWLLSLLGESVNENRQYGAPGGSPGAVELEKDRSVMVLGETGSGKTKAIEVLAHQLQAAPDEPLVAFDYKQDYQDFFTDTFRVSSVDADVRWNVFKEIENEDECKEIAKAIFSSADNDYFMNTASQVFEGILILLNRWAEEDEYEPSNEDLLQYVGTADVTSLRQDFEDEELSMAKHMSEDAEAAENVLSNLEMQVSEVFSGDFAKDGDFSIREYMANPQGQTLILDLPVERSASVKPIFRLLVDWSIRFGMIDERGSYYILDEFAALPRLSMLERLVNAGRAYNCYAIFGIQAISQVNSTYGRDDAESLLSGMAQEIHLRVGDETSVRYWRQRLGKDQITRGSDGHERIAEEHAISPRAIQNLEPGQGVIHTTTGWQRGRLYMLSEVIGDLLPAEESTFQRYRHWLANRNPALDSGTSEDIAVEGTDSQAEAAIEETDGSQEPADD